MVRKSLAVMSWISSAIATSIAVTHAISHRSLSSFWTGVALAIALLGIATGQIVYRYPPLMSGVVLLCISGVALASVLADTSNSWFVYEGLSTSYPEILFLGVLIILIPSLLSLIRQRLGTQARSVVIDGLIVGLGAWVIVWVLLVRPTLDNTVQSGALTILTFCSLVAAIIVLFLLATILFSDSNPNVSVVLISISVFAFLTGTVLRSVVARGDIAISTSLVQAPFIFAIAIAGATFLHPTTISVTNQSGMRYSPPLMTRLITTTASLIAPVIVLAITDPTSTQDRIIRTVSVVVLAIAVMVRVIQSVRQNAKTQGQLMRNALTDSLTGLPNRVLMIEHIEEALNASRFTSRQPTVLFIDVDRFKTINDSLGHSTGDDVLTTIALRLQNKISGNAIVGRISGDEFVVLDPDTHNPAQSVLLAERILDVFTDPMGHETKDMFVTASIGVAYAPTGIRLSAEMLLRHADTAMYQAKDAGRNCISIFDDSMLDSVTKRLNVETALYRALERNELHLEYQPIVDIDLGLVVGFEALMRWNRGAEGAVSPVDFIPIAEETGIIVPLGTWALKDALAQLRFWIDTKACQPHTTMSVNVSARQIHDPQFVSVVSEALLVTGINAEQLWLEVTESVMIIETAQALSSLQRLNALGVRISIDDFGTGYSSLSLLQKFPVQCIKIDRSFVQNIATDNSTHSIVRTIIAMATSIGADIVAEGVEEISQLDTLRHLQCHKAQGYLISRPIEVEHVPAVVRQLEDPQFWQKQTMNN